MLYYNSLSDVKYQPYSSNNIILQLLMVYNIPLLLMLFYSLLLITYMNDFVQICINLVFIVATKEGEQPHIGIYLLFMLWNNNNNFVFGKYQYLDITTTNSYIILYYIISNCFILVFPTITNLNHIQILLIYEQ